MDLALLLKALVLGVVEGLTEFLPVSSTGHLILTADLLDFNDERGKLFGIVIQCGAILAVVIEYRRRLFNAVRHVHRDPLARRFWLNLAIAFLPLALLGLAFGSVGFAVESGHFPDIQQHLLVGVIVVDADQRPGGANLDAQLLLQLSAERGLGRLAGLDLAAGELPVQGQRLVLAALGEQHLAVLTGDQGGDDELAGTRRAIHGLLGGGSRRGTASLHRAAPRRKPPMWA